MKHLDEYEIAQAAGWLVGMTEELPVYIQKHLKECLDCKMEVLEVGEIINSWVI